MFVNELPPKGDYSPIDVPRTTKYLVLDIETTGFIGRNRLMPDIIQFSVAELRTRKFFSRYIFPTVGIPSRITQLTGISCTEDYFGVKTMYADGEEVHAVSIYKALTEFWKWCEEEDMDDVVFVAHNGKTFDFPILMGALARTKMTGPFLRRTLGFIDSLSMMRELRPDLGKYSLDHLVSVILRRPRENAHDALEDARDLRLVLLASHVNKEDLEAQVFSPCAVIQQNRYLRARSSH